jgi:hypothetical protein
MLKSKIGIKTTYGFGMTDGESDVRIYAIQREKFPNQLLRRITNLVPKIER